MANSIRLIVMASFLGLLAAAGTLYAANKPGSSTAYAVWPNARALDNAREELDWTICRTVSASDPGPDWAQLDSDFADGKQALANGAWNTAIKALNYAAVRDPRNADIQTYLGYAHWHAGNFGPAMGNFQQALLINPRHRSAHQHLGELYLALKEPDRAKHQLAALKEICLIPCEEFDRLQQKIFMSDSFLQPINVRVSRKQ